MLLDGFETETSVMSNQLEMKVGVCIKILAYPSVKQKRLNPDSHLLAKKREKSISFVFR